jgi:predicted outer membrane repeat protein
VVQHNEASYGGGLKIGSGSLTVDDSAAPVSITDNTASVFGGGLYASGASTVTFTGSTVSGNTAARGGGILLWDGSLTLNDSQIINNSSDFHGAGVYLAAGTSTLIGTTISGNQAVGDGGGFYSGGTGTATFTGSTVSGNTASHGGGIVSSAGTTLVIDNTTIGGATAADGNVASGGVGGGILSYGFVTLQNGAVVQHNEASYGGGLNIGSGSLTLDGTTSVKYNVASVTGGGIYGASGVTINLNGADVSENTPNDTAGDAFPPLLAATTVAGTDGADLTMDVLSNTIELALADWQAAGLGSEGLATLSSADYVIADLSGNRLGLAAHDTIYVDVDAFGYGWSTDAAEVADDQFDLLTVLEHEMGHLLGLEDLDDSIDDLMSETLELGQRQSIDAEVIDRIFGGE